ncbi:MAG: ABC transporter ATP-binding protein [Clostridia bacterium]|nr:ABC transporter ATP-binding protein [Clostridia bacterium]
MEHRILTEEAARLLEKDHGDRVIFSLSSNLNRKGEGQEFLLLFGTKGVYVFCEETGECRAYPFEKMRDVRYERFVGGGACLVLCEGEWEELCRSFGSGKENLSQLTRILKEVLDGVLKPEDACFTERHTVCPKCRRPLGKGSQLCPNCSDKKGSFKQLLQLIRGQYGWIVLSMILFFVHSLLNVLLPMLQRNFVDEYLTVKDPHGLLADYAPAVTVVLSMALIRIFAVLSTVVRNVILAKISTKTVVELRRRLYEKIQSLSVAGISRHTAGDLMNRVSGDTTTIAQFMTEFLPSILEQLFVIVFVGAVLFSHSVKMALMILIPAPFVAILFRIVWRKTHRLYHRHWVENSNVNTILHDVFQGVRVVKVFGTEKNEIEKYDHAVRAQRDIAVRNEIAWAKLVPYAEYLIQVGNFILLYYAGNEILKQNMTIGELTMFSSFVSLIYTPLRSMANYPRRIQRAATAVAKVFEVLDEEPDVADKKGAEDIDIRGQIDIDGIWFGYDENENVLENVSVSVSPGEMLGIVGRSGVGKSTLINLVMRLYDVQRGAIRIDGKDVRDISQHSLRSQIGVVLQETFLFAGSIYENLAYAKPDATYEEVISAARLGGAHSFIMKLPDGYDTVVGEKGYTLSGGERQRIAIARAILHDPKILILDEATSALDTETEKLIQESLAYLCKDRTTIAIAHRLSTLRNATKLLVLDKKTVAEVGTHEELMEKEDGIYKSLVIAQREMSRVKKTDVSEEQTNND